MLTDSFKKEIVDEIARLDDDNQRRVLDFARALVAAGKRGVSGKRLLSFGGGIPAEDLNEIQNAIAEHCEKVDRNEW